MSDKLSREDALELLRVMHEDQGLHQPAFSREFALRVINIVSDWFEPGRGYYNTVWLERWEEVKVEEPAPAVRLEPASPPPNSDDEVPF